MFLLSWTNPLTNRATRPLGVRRLTAMRTSCKFEGISDALPLYVIKCIVEFDEEAQELIEDMFKKAIKLGRNKVMEMEDGPEKKDLIRKLKKTDGPVYNSQTLINILPKQKIKMIHLN